LAETYPEHREQIYVPYAKWLAESDKFVEAQKAFHKAGRPDEGIVPMKNLPCTHQYFYFNFSNFVLSLYLISYLFSQHSAF
jgi:hypothetical protein